MIMKGSEKKDVGCCRKLLSGTLSVKLSEISTETKRLQKCPQ